MTPLLWPVWCEPSCGSLSRRTTRSPGWASVRAKAVPRPTMPPPMTARSVVCVTAARIPSPSRSGPPSPLRGEGRARGPYLVERQGDRAVVRAQHVGQDRRPAHAWAQLVGDEEVVDAPADVP